MMRAFGIFTLLALLVPMMACQTSLSDEDVERVAEKAVERMSEISMDEATVNRMVDAMMEHPKYLEAVQWSDAEIQALVAAQMAHPGFRAMLEWSDEEIQAMVAAQIAHPDFQITPEEDCATVILTAVVIAGDYQLPPDSEVERLCTWYLGQTQ